MASLYIGEDNEDILLGFIEDDNNDSHTIREGIIIGGGVNQRGRRGQRGNRGRGGLRRGQGRHENWREENEQRGNRGGRRGRGGERGGRSQNQDIDGLIQNGEARGRGNNRGRGRGKRGGTTDQGHHHDRERGGEEGGRGRGRNRGGERGGRGRGGGGTKSSHIHRLDIKDLIDMTKCTPEDIVLKLQDDLKGFQTSLNGCNKVPEKIKNTYICTVINLLLKVCQARCGDSHEGASTILAEFLSIRCSEFHMLLKTYISSIIIYDGTNYEVTLHAIYKLFQSLLDNFPTSSWPSLPIDDLLTAVKEFSSSLSLESKVTELKAQRDDIKKQQTEKKKQVNIDERNWDNTLYRTHPILPTMDEICSAAPPLLRSNIITGAYTDWEHYYDVQFRLLREDFLAPLRRGVTMFCSAERTGRLTDINVYNDVKIVSPEFTENGICYTVQFDVSRFRQRKTWTHSKRLIFGSLLCFSPVRDKFKEHVYFATVTDRKPEELDKGIFHVQFENGLDMLQHIQKNTFTVLESKAYFEASRHILRSLQTAETGTMPFTRYLINNQTTPVNAPQYLHVHVDDMYDTLLLGSHANHFYDIRWLYPNNKETISLRERFLFMELRNRKIDITGTWPNEDEIDLDKSQIKAIKMALTQEISVIQGPPGTGKTYIGYKIVQTLLQNREVWDPNKTSPILVMCYTNHALDQFLQGIIDHKISCGRIEETPNIIRIGGRSKSDKIQEFSLYNARGKFASWALRDLHEKKKSLLKIASIIPWHGMQRLIQNPINEFIIGQEGFVRLRRSIHPTHFYQLTLLASENDGLIELSLEYWLGLWNKVPVKSPDQAPEPNQVPTQVPSTATDESVPAINSPNDLSTEHDIAVSTEHSTSASNEVHMEEQTEDVSDEVDTDDEEEVIQVTGEAEIEEGNRQLDNDGFQQFEREETEEYTGEIHDAFSERLESQRSLNQPSKQPQTFQYIKKPHEVDTDDEEEVIQVTGEAEIEEGNRRLDNDGFQQFEREETEEYTGEIHDAFSERLESQRSLNQPSKQPQTFQYIKKPHEVDTDDEEEVIQVTGEAEIEEGNRRLDNDGFQQFEREETEEYTGEIHDAFSERLESQRSLNQPSKQPQTFQYIKKPQNEIDIILRDIRNCEPFDQDDEEDIEDISHLSVLDRYRLFRLWVARYKEHLGDFNERALQYFETKCRQYMRNQKDIDRIALEEVDVIGMTTTGAAKYQHILHLVKPKIVIVEEAAEVLESHIVSALNAGTQHLILIGDHKQLRPKPNEYELAKKHNFDVSLFERLIRNGLPHATLLIQHRMRPQIASLVRPSIYETLINHESVEKYDSIRSCDKNMYFFHHTFPETEIEHLLSHSNISEAELVVALCRHLLKQGYKSSQITILTAYTGQLLCVRDKMPRNEFEGVQVTNVDNFQGEENDIIILSLVRNNDARKVGFLREENRVCVALSRARMGFYCFGNFEMLRSVVPIWEVILSQVSKEGCLGSALPLHCHNHPDFKVPITKAHEFAVYFPEGGCKQPCMYPLDCGHCCKKTCHVTDPEHTDYRCREKCLKSCSNGHPCKAPCFRECPLCNVPVDKIIPSCGHTQTMKCHEDPSYVKCMSPCPKRCQNNLHDCPLKCSEECTDCYYQVTRNMPNCGHEVQMPCYEDPLLVKCYYPCLKKCASGLHECPKECWEDCGVCKVSIKKIIPRCEHEQMMFCHEDPKEFRCHKMCKKIYDGCGHKCLKKCYEECDSLCQELVPKELPKCSHIVELPCSMDPSIAMCTRPCERTRHCGHPCKGQCGEICISIKCDEPKPLKLPCTHEISVHCSDHLEAKFKLLTTGSYECDEPCLKTLPCDHQCKNKCKDPCSTVCNVKVPYTCPKGVHTMKLRCHLHANPPLCNKPCGLKLPCGHQCKKKCNEECREVCDFRVSKKCRCGHKHNFKCGDDKCFCREKCSTILECGHKCLGYCGDCFTNRIHAPCVFQLQVNRFCGHSGSLPCVGLLDKCEKSCRLSICPHNKEECEHKCFEDCPARKCREKCTIECPHDKCSLDCSQICIKPGCKEPCTKTLKCGHHCSGACGEKCIEYCWSCNRKKYIEKVKGLGKKATSPQTCLQLDCGHVFTLSYLDQRFSPKKGHDKIVCPLACPSCSKPIVSKYFWKTSQIIMEDMKEIKRRLAVPRIEYDRLRFSVEDMLLMKRIRTKHEFLSKRDSEGLCALTLIDSASKLQSEIESCYLPENDEIIKGIKNLIDVIINILRETKGKLSSQIIRDVESELYRFSLIGLKNKMVQKVVLDKSSSGPFQTLCDQIQLIEDDHSIKLDSQKYNEIFRLINRLFISRLTRIELQCVPQVTKGHWYKCSRAGHIYFVPAKYGGPPPSCTICK